jgi:hypothetical protein
VLLQARIGLRRKFEMKNDNGTTIVKRKTNDVKITLLHSFRLIGDRLLQQQKTKAKEKKKEHQSDD